MDISHQHRTVAITGQAAKWEHCTGVCTTHREAARLMAFMARHSVAVRTARGRAQVAQSQRRHSFETKYLRGRTLHLRLMDLPVYYEIFLGRGYDAALRQLAPEPTVIDLGAHVGLFALRTKMMRPGARVVSVEPAGDNAELWRRNTADLYDVHLEEAAYHPTEPSLLLEASGLGHSYRTRVTGGGTAVVPAVSLGELIAKHGIDGVDMIKVDIEGAEGAIVGSDDERMLARSRQLILEVHQPLSIGDFAAAVGDRTVYELTDAGHETLYFIA